MDGENVGTTPYPKAITGKKYQNYFDIDDSLDKSNYTSNIGSGYHYSKFDSNVRSINTLAFLDIKLAIQKLFEDLPQILVTECTEDISSNLNLDLTINKQPTRIL